MLNYRKNRLIRKNYRSKKKFKMFKKKKKKFKNKLIVLNRKLRT